MVTSVPAGIATSRTSACGLAPFSAAATIVSKASSDEPCSWKSSRTRQATSRSVRPVKRSSASAANIRSEIAAASRIVSISAGSFTARSRSTRPCVGTRLDATVLQRLVARDGEDVRLDPDRAAGEPRREVADHGARRLLEADPVEGLRLLGVAKVREERRLAVGGDEQRGVRAREPGEVADVDPARDEERLVEERREALDPGQLWPARNAIAVR